MLEFLGKHWDSNLAKTESPASYLCWKTHVGKQLAAMLAVKRSAGVAPEVNLCWNMHVGKQLAAMLAIKRSAGVAPEVNFREHISLTPPPSMNKAANSGFETQRGYQQKSKTEISMTPQKGLMSSQKLKKRILRKPKRKTKTSNKKAFQ